MPIEIRNSRGVYIVPSRYDVNFVSVLFKDLSYDVIFVSVLFKDLSYGWKLVSTGSQFVTLRDLLLAGF